MRGWLRGVAGGAGLLLIAGCADPQLTSLDRELAEIRNSPAPVPTIELPEIPDYETLPYDHADLRSPFVPRLPEVEEPTEVATDLAPDLDREREALEAYNLSELRLVGTLTEGGQPSALVRAPDGQVHRLRVGNHMGSDFGRIVSITSSTVQLIEIVPTGRGGWVERTTRLELNGQQGG
ncbi:pilus assembly protein PilP [Halomonas sp. KAO]|uniref:pilus assembly protein PilP n=1 Tax=unclassified Halomonas TaxID=2609666 RepID=UPI00189F0EC3|nr:MULTISPECIES: pilus assembly protein PilP [unclassified Halomonas]MBF7053768.1 pilus assembly protein PilP [Halomonas sp. KAO]MDT0502417.1 pilus assembly protein PilP [Halomonas sp. PAR7]MDT0511933.1 pilus assembly protein PilP [Halomonas sp. LES1]MDT0592880.1 pilus assembly protein PilP [Halomonas sp. PAR8]